MKSKKSTKKIKQCALCTHFNGTDCTCKSNIGLRVMYRKEYTVYLKKPDVLNKDGKCENYAEA